jgi:hypothetical protein
MIDSFKGEGEDVKWRFRILLKELNNFLKKLLYLGVA